MLPIGLPVLIQISLRILQRQPILREGRVLTDPHVHSGSGADVVEEERVGRREGLVRGWVDGCEGDLPRGVGEMVECTGLLLWGN